MKQEIKILLLGLLAVVLLDTLGSIASRQFDFNYSFLSPISFLIYGYISFLVTLKKDMKTGIIYAILLGLFDSTIGWKLSMLLDANTGSYDYKITTGFLIFLTIFMIGFSALIGLIGGLLARKIKKNPIK
jgi:uncharacterized membrane protein YeaQ/YmgE (transglycosylase-associated protein family)